LAISDSSTRGKEKQGRYGGSSVRGVLSAIKVVKKRLLKKKKRKKDRYGSKLRGKTGFRLLGKRLRTDVKGSHSGEAGVVK